MLRELLGKLIDETKFESNKLSKEFEDVKWFLSTHTWSRCFICKLTLCAKSWNISINEL